MLFTSLFQKKDLYYTPSFLCAFFLKLVLTLWCPTVRHYIFSSLHLQEINCVFISENQYKRLYLAGLGILIYSFLCVWSAHCWVKLMLFSNPPITAVCMDVNLQRSKKKKNPKSYHFEASFLQRQGWSESAGILGYA